MTRPSRPSASARSSSSRSAAIDCSRSGPRGRRDVDQIAVVRDDRMDAGLGDPPPEERDLLVGQRRAPPLARGLREDLQRLAARDRGDRRDRRRAAGPPAIDRMGAEPRHQSPKTSAAKRKTLRAALPRVRRQTGLDAGLAQELLRRPAPLGGDLRQQQAAAAPARRRGRGRPIVKASGPRIDRARAARAPRPRAPSSGSSSTGHRREPRILAWRDSPRSAPPRAARPARLCSVPRQPRSSPRRLIVTNTPRRVGHSRPRRRRGIGPSGDARRRPTPARDRSKRCRCSPVSIRQQASVWNVAEGRGEVADDAA